MSKTTEQLINEDGVLDEKAAGEEIDRVMNETKEEPKEETLIQGDEQSVEDDAATDDGESDSDDWTTADDISELADSLGYSEDDLSDFSGPEEFERHVRLLDRELKRNRPGDAQELALEADEIGRKKDERLLKVEEQYRENGKFAKKPIELPKLDPDEFDERLVEALEARDAKIAELEEMLNGNTQNSILQGFDNIVDDMNLPDLFGTSEKPNRAERSRLFDEYKEMFNYLEAQGKPVSGKKANRAIVLRAYNLEFADEIKKQSRRELTTKAKRQASRITGSARRSGEKKYDGPVEKDPSLLQAFKEMEAENG